MTDTEINIRHALEDIAKALREPENYDPPDLEEIRIIQRMLEQQLEDVREEVPV